MITDDDIRRVLPQRSFAAGVRYHLDGRVIEAHLEMLFELQYFMAAMRFISDD